MRTLKELAKEALDVQDACNIGGVSRRFADVVQDVRNARAAIGRPINSTDEMNQHPIVQLWASKIHDLTRADYAMNFAKAYDECTRLSMASEESLASVG